MKDVKVAILVAIFLIGGTLIFIGTSNSGPEERRENVSIIDGVQVIDISARGGYLPKVTYAKAGIPTVLKVETYNTFDCSSALVIPSLGYRKTLEPSGIEEIEVPPQNAGEKINGLCSMGMYGFEVKFE